MVFSISFLSLSVLQFYYSILFYDNEGKPYKIVVDDNGTVYTGYYALNQQGDVIAILDANGNIETEYNYNAWGLEVAKNPDSRSVSMLAQYNCLKYRGYYYDAETGFYYLGSRYYDPVIGRFINPDTTDVLTANPTAMTDKNLYAYCDNNPVMRVDKDGNIWELALASGETMALGSGSAIVAGLSAAAPVAIGVAITVVVVVGVSAAIKFAKSKSNKKTKEEVDPYARPGQKKQGRETKIKSRRSQKFKSRNNRRDNKPAQPKSHTPSRKGHTKYYP